MSHIKGANSRGTDTVTPTMQNTFPRCSSYLEILNDLRFPSPSISFFFFYSFFKLLFTPFFTDAHQLSLQSPVPFIYRQHISIFQTILLIRTRHSVVLSEEKLVNHMLEVAAWFTSEEDNIYLEQWELFCSGSRAVNIDFGLLGRPENKKDVSDWCCEEGKFRCKLRKPSVRWLRV